LGLIFLLLTVELSYFAKDAQNLAKCFLALGSVAGEGGKLGKRLDKGSGRGYKGDKLEFP